MKKLILFGAGANGMEALQEYGVDKVICFCDNKVTKWGTEIQGVPILSFDEMIKQYNENLHVIMITPDEKAFICGQLELAGIREYVFYKSQVSFDILEFQSKYEEDYKEQNKILCNYAQKTQEYDLLQDVSKFKNLVSEIIQLNFEGLELANYGIGSEGNFYGNLDTLLEYADYLDFDKAYAPVVSHNAGVPLVTTETRYKIATIFSGKYYKEKIHKWRPYVPVFSVGPYLQYATGIYSKDRIKELKERNGKTLTVFLPHTIEKIKRNYSKRDFINDVFVKYGGQFEQIYLCVYWADLLDDCCLYAEKKGMHIMSAGFRFDPMFTKRLRSIFELSDFVLGGDFGTHYNYAMHMGLPAAKIGISDEQTIHDSEFNSELQKKVQFGSFYQEYRKQFFELYTEKFACNEEQKKWLEPYAGYEIKRSKNYIRNIFDISKDILIDCDGKLPQYPDSVKTVFSKYLKDNEFDKMSILAEAVGNYIYY